MQEPLRKKVMANQNWVGVFLCRREVLVVWECVEREVEVEDEEDEEEEDGRHRRQQQLVVQRARHPTGGLHHSADEEEKCQIM